MRQRINKIIKKILKLEKSDREFSSEIYNWDNCDFNTNGELFLIKAYARTWKIIFDIGANKGDYSNLVLQNNPYCKCICFEPNYEIISKDTEQLIIEPLAIGADVSQVELNINTEDSTQSSIYRQNEHTVKKRVHQTSIDAYILQKNITEVDFIKIDIEGNEINCLKGMQECISNRKIKMIQFEYGGTFLDADVKLQDAYELLSNNYIICQLTPGGLLPLDYSEELETYRYSNWIAIARNY